MMKILYTALSLLLSATLPVSGEAQPSLPDSAEVRDLIILVNDHWQEEHQDPGRAFWDNAAYHTGNMEAYAITKKKEYLKYSKKWVHYGGE